MKYNLYNNKIKLEFDEAKHKYLVDGKIVYGVTGILSVLSTPALINWAVKLTADKVREMKQYIPDSLEDVLKAAKYEHYRVSKEARELGTRVHRVADSWFFENKLELIEEMLKVESTDERNALRAFIKLVKDVKMEREFGERKIYSKKHGYAGTVDFIGKIEGVETVADYKTSRAIYPSYFIQAAAYAQAIEEELGKKIKQTAVIRIAKDGTLEIKTDKKWKEKLPVFLAMKSIYEWQMSLVGKDLDKKVEEQNNKPNKK